MIEYLPNREYTGYMSRYSDLRVIRDPDGVYLETQDPIVINDGTSDSHHIVQESEVNRLDIIASKYYDDPSLWWVIALANDMINPFTVSRDTVLRVPKMISVVSSLGRRKVQ